MIIEKKQRDLSIDILKIFALIHMIYDHLYITLYENSTNIKIIDFIDNIIPICPALFLFLSGYSLTIGNSFLKIGKRLITALFLITTSSIFFVAENGFQFPDFIFSSGILYTIGLNIIICTFIGNLKKHKIKTTSAIFLLSSLMFIYLRIKGQNIFHLTTGYEPFLPTVIYGFAGYLYGQLKKEGYINKVTKISISALSVFILTIYSFVYGIFAPLFPDIGRYTIERIFNGNYYFPTIFSQSANPVHFTARIWNFDISCFFYSLSIVLLLVIISDYIVNNRKIKINKYLIMPARYLIINYIFHLSIIALCSVLFGFGIFNSFQFIMFYIGMITSIYLFNFILDFLRKPVK